jgi:hypothetical protein
MFDENVEPVYSSRGDAGPQVWPVRRATTDEVFETTFEGYLQCSIADARYCATDHSETRPERLARIQAAIAGGHYAVSAADLAQKLLETMRGNFH